MRLFLKRFLIFCIPLYIFFALAFYYSLNVKPNMSGDIELANGLIVPGSRDYYDSLCTPYHSQCYFHYYHKDSTYTNIKCVNIGDSFTTYHGGQIVYVNRMSQEIPQQVLTIPRYSISHSPFSYAMSILNSGYLDSLGCRYVVVESVGRELPRWLLSLDLDTDPDMFTEQRVFPEGVERVQHKDADLLSHLRYGARDLINFISLKIKSGGDSFRRVKLRRPHFSILPQTLWFYGEDLIYTHLSEAELSMIAENITAMRDRFAEHNMQLIILGVVDRYDLYQDEIVDNPYSPKDVLEQIESVAPSGLFVNTKRILKPMVERGEQDIWYSTDLHWSKKAAEVVGEYMSTIVR